MSISKRVREQIYNKYGGRCAYCGYKLGEKWHIDHLEPLRRDLTTGLPLHPERERFDNYMPACISCNINKHSLSLEEFRSLISGFISSLNNNSTQYKIAKRYGLVKENEDLKVRFHFENFINR